MMKKIIALIIIVCLVAAGFFVARNQKTKPLAQEEPEAQSETAGFSIVSLTFPEGYSTVQIAEKLEENGVCSASDFMAEVNNIDAYKETFAFLENIDTKNKAYALEGYIFPDTYEFYTGESAANAIARFLQNTDAKLTDEYKGRAKETGLSTDEVIILASIVQKEAGFKEEMAKVASVFHNRLKSPDYPKLQSDVTIDYVNNYIYDSPYLDEDTSKYGELYNTYKCNNLPAGAVCNPGIEAIKAVLYPADTNYLFFVTDSENNYYYAATYDEHLANCKICGY